MEQQRITVYPEILDGQATTGITRDRSFYLDDPRPQIGQPESGGRP
jgi:hypothetical protein